MPFFANVNLVVEELLNYRFISFELFGNFTRPLSKRATRVEAVCVFGSFI
jgi:hypothetical protein